MENGVALTESNGARGIDFVTKPVTEEIFVGKVKIFLDYFKYKKGLYANSSMSDMSGVLRNMSLASWDMSKARETCLPIQKTCPKLIGTCPQTRQICL